MSTSEDTLLSGQVSATDADGDHLTFSVVTGPSQGTVALHSDGSFWYTPPAFYSGTDSFTFEAYDGQAYSNVATVSITINAVTLPQVANIPFTTIADGTVADRNLDGTYDTVDTTNQSITDRWFTDPTIGQERGVFEFDLSRIAPGTPILSATIALDVTSYTAGTVGGVTTYPQAQLHGRGRYRHRDDGRRRQPGHLGRDRHGLIAGLIMSSRSPAPRCSHSRADSR